MSHYLHNSCAAFDIFLVQGPSFVILLVNFLFGNSQKKVSPAALLPNKMQMLVNSILLLATRDSFHRFGVTYESNMLHVQYLPTILQRFFLFVVLFFTDFTFYLFFWTLSQNDSCSRQTKAGRTTALSQS